MTLGTSKTGSNNHSAESRKSTPRLATHAAVASGTALVALCLFILTTIAQPYTLGYSSSTILLVVIFVAVSISWIASRDQNRNILERLGNASANLAKMNVELRSIAAENRALHNINERYNALVNSHDLLIVTRDIHDDITSINQSLADFLEIDPTQWSGQRFENLVKLLASSLVDDNDAAVSVSDKPTQFTTIANDSEHRLKLANGGERWIRWHEQEIRSSDGRVVEYVSVGADITYRKLAEVDQKSIQGMDRESRLAKSRFLAMVSHEIRTPLNGVFGMIDLMLLTDLNTTQRDYALTVRKSAKALLSLIDEILDLSSVEAGRFTVASIPFNLADMMLETAELLAPRASNKGLDVALYIDPHLPTQLIGDPKRIRQILLNLAGNAIKFTETGGITIEARYQIDDAELSEQKPHIRFDVHDSGSGISDSDRVRLFEEFEQADNSHARKHEGTGLGLSISRRLIQSMRGTISVSSTVGVGSIFTAFVPLVRDQISEPESVTQISDIRSHTFIVATRLKRHAELIEELFTRIGASVVIAQNRLELTNLISRTHCDTLIVSRTFDNTKVENLLPPIHTSGNVEKNIRTVVLATQFEMLAETQFKNVCDAIVTVPHSTEVLLAAILAAHQSDDSKSESGSDNDLEHATHNVSDNLSPMGESSISETSPKQSNLSGSASSQPTPQTNSCSTGILLAEDNHTNARIALSLLKHMGVVADHVINGTEAVAWTQNRLSKELPIDLILMDIRMPGMDGLEACSEICKLDGASKNQIGECSIPIIALTANTSQEDRNDCLAAGMKGILEKPAGYRELRSALEQFAPSVVLNAASEHERLVAL